MRTRASHLDSPASDQAIPEIPLAMTLIPASWPELERSVRFGDTDAAGVMHFHHLLRCCHEAYEESLERHGLSAGAGFPRPLWAGIE